jgi:hypothetical protein
MAFLAQFISDLFKKVDKIQITKFLTWKVIMQPFLEPLKVKNLRKNASFWFFKTRMRH